MRTRVPQMAPGDTTVDTGGEFGDGRKSRALRHFELTDEDVFARVSAILDR